ncbi:MAG: Rieske 2Fe-2S domain-containing protein [Myxococcales bacterium]|nr:Rieske 2Fe-2S domain-containing protein [Myxococcales bacterium]
MQRYMLEPPHYAYDWFSPLRSEEVVKGRVTNFTFMGHELVAFRDENDQVVVLDAHCPHFGGHLGHGLAHGVHVVDGCIRCPFHGLHFDKNGQCVKGDFVKDTGGLRHLKTTPWTVRETLSSIFIWHGADRTKPTRELVFTNMDFDGWTPAVTNEGRILAPTNLFFPTENIVDVQHFYAVHFWELNEVIRAPGEDENGAFSALLNMKWTFGAQSRFDAVRRIGQFFGSDYLFDIAVWGPGIAISRASVPMLGGATVMSVILITPTNETDCRIRVVSSVKKAYDWAPNRLLRTITGQGIEDVMARLFLWVATNDFDGDEIIWTHRKFLANPKPLKDDGPLIAYRKWSLRFWPDDYAPAPHRERGASPQMADAHS